MILLGVISAVAFATILAVVAGLTITASASFAHDVYASVMKNHQVTEDEQVPGLADHRGGARHRRDRTGHPGQRAERGVPGGPAFAVAASANLPTIVYSLYWRRFNTRGRCGACTAA